MFIFKLTITITFEDLIYILSSFEGFNKVEESANGTLKSNYGVIGYGNGVAQNRKKHLHMYSTVR